MEDRKTLRLVLDTNVALSFLLSRGAAFAFGADLLVTRDSDLLALKHFYGCKIIRPARALQICRNHLSSQS